jgi:hypothetical protein
MGTWKRIDLITYPTKVHLQETDECYYAKDYIAGAGFQGGIVNSDILNFKKTPTLSGQQYRTQAIQKFADEVSHFLDCDLGKIFSVTAIPSSKIKTDSEYDNRFEDFFQELKKRCPCIDVVWPVIAMSSVPATHQSKSPRNPIMIMQNYQFNGFDGFTPDRLIVFDDLLTSGAHFRAYKDFLIQSKFKGEVIGVFWAKS